MAYHIHHHSSLGEDSKGNPILMFSGRIVLSGPDERDALIGQSAKERARTLAYWLLDYARVKDNGSD